jgi:hypothetical protein
MSPSKVLSAGVRLWFTHGEPDRRRRIEIHE